jgi:hypothetical protein
VTGTFYSAEEFTSGNIPQRVGVNWMTGIVTTNLTP